MIYINNTPIELDVCINGDGHIKYYKKLLNEWCEKNCEGTWLVVYIEKKLLPGFNVHFNVFFRIFFSEESDATLFKLTWCETSD